MALQESENMLVVGEARDGDDALQRIHDQRPDVVILDLDMPMRDGLSVVREMNRLKSSTAVIILTLHTGADLLFEALDLGVQGYILKGSEASDVVEAVRRVSGGGNFLSEAVHSALQRGRPEEDVPLALSILTPVELMLVRKIAEGFTSREIAAVLNLSGRTIDNYRTSICSKLKLAGPNALLRFALSQRSSLTLT